MIRRIRKEDKEAYISMAAEFYSSDAVHHRVPRTHFADTFEEMMRSDVHVAGFIFEYENNTAGYALLAKTFSQEAGGKVVWIEELYVRPAYQNRGLGHAFFRYLRTDLGKDTKRVRLEAAKGNQKAISFYQRMGFETLPYIQMVQDAVRQEP